MTSTASFWQSWTFIRVGWNFESFYSICSEENNNKSNSTKFDENFEQTEVTRRTGQTETNRSKRIEK